jgi:hypothetical protein
VRKRESVNPPYTKYKPEYTMEGGREGGREREWAAAGQGGRGAPSAAATQPSRPKSASTFTVRATSCAALPPSRGQPRSCHAQGGCLPR